MDLVYEDSRGWLYKVMSGLGDNQYKARYKKPGAVSWHCVRTLPWRDNPPDAEKDLIEFAKKKRMRRIVTN